MPATLSSKNCCNRMKWLWIGALEKQKKSLFWHMLSPPPLKFCGTSTKLHRLNKPILAVSWMQGYLYVPSPAFGQAAPEVNVNVLHARTLLHNMLQQHLWQIRKKERLSWSKSGQMHEGKVTLFWRQTHRPSTEQEEDWAQMYNPARQPPP